MRANGVFVASAPFRLGWAAILAGTLLAIPLAAQQTGTTGGSTGTTTGGGTTGAGTTTPGTGGGTTTGTGRTGTTIPQPQTTQPTPQPDPRPIFISGAVSTDDGSEIPPNTTIQTRCDGDKRTAAYVRSNGDFGFRFGDTSGVFMDASESNASSLFSGAAPNAGNSRRNGIDSGSVSDRIMNCEIFAQAAGFVSTTISLMGHTSTDSPEIGMIILHRMGGDEGRVVSIKALKAPSNAKKAFSKGSDLLMKGKYADAAKSLEQAIGYYPEYADAWLNLGRARIQLNAADARDALVKAQELDPLLDGTWEELGMMAAREANWKDAAANLDRSTKLNPLSSPQIWYAAAIAHTNLQQYDEAERSVRAAMKLDQRKEIPKAYFLLGVLLAARHNYTDAAQHINTYLKTAPAPADEANAKRELARINQARATENAPDGAAQPATGAAR